MPSEPGVGARLCVRPIEAWGQNFDAHSGMAGRLTDGAELHTLTDLVMWAASARRSDNRQQLMVAAMSRGS
jgi:sulfur relay (sulfurtransferase) complex TusBCD TusD component (DsrE family)